jgi:two-component system chemotaxis sensor kinase CheA
MATGLYAGTTLADDGSPILLFDPAGVAQVGGVRLEAQERTARVVEAATAIVQRDNSVLLFKGLDDGRRALRLAVVDRIEEVERKAIRKAAGQLRVQLGDTILPLAGADALPKGDEKVRIFRLNDGTHEIGYAFREVIDLMAMDAELIPADNPGAVSGVTLIGGEPAELIDAHWLFANHLGGAAKPAAQSVCRLPSDDPWMQNMLRPIVEAAGYIVIGEEDELLPDLVIASDGQPVSAAEGAKTIVLRSDPDGEDGETIYRYDRAGLLMALKAAGRGK